MVMRCTHRVWWIVLKCAKSGVIGNNSESCTSTLSPVESCCVFIQIALAPFWSINASDNVCVLCMCVCTVVGKELNMWGHRLVSLLLVVSMDFCRSQEWKVQSLFLFVRLQPPIELESFQLQRSLAERDRQRGCFAFEFYVQFQSTAILFNNLYLLTPVVFFLELTSHSSEQLELDLCISNEFCHVRQQSNQRKNAIKSTNRHYD